MGERETIKNLNTENIFVRKCRKEDLAKEIIKHKGETITITCGYTCIPQICPQHMFLTIHNDEELGGLLPCGIITRDGILPNITRVLQPKKTVEKTSSSGGKEAKLLKKVAKSPKKA